MSKRNIAYVYKFVLNFLKQKNWVNGRPVLINGDVWCPMCEHYHANNSYCQQPY